jgi:hypothetical protein
VRGTVVIGEGHGDGPVQVELSGLTPPAPIWITEVALRGHSESSSE